MFWPTGILHPMRPRRFILRRPSTRRFGFTRRTSIVLILFLVCTILFLTRVLGENARNTPRQKLLKLKQRERENWKATHDAYIQLARQAQQARGRKAWLLRKRIVDLGKGIWTKDTEDESTRGCPTVAPQEPVQPSPHPPALHYHDEDLEAADLYGYHPGVPAVGQHDYKPNGLLNVNPAGPHPIYELITRSEEKWLDKHRRASKTLTEAVEEYKKRYGRLPPTGFDMWWEYVQQNHVYLPDEYDQINEDLARYWAVDPVDLQAIQRTQEGHADTFTIGKDTWSAPLSVLNFSFNGDGGLMSDHWDPVPSDTETPRLISKRSELPVSFFATPHAHTHNQHLNGAFNIFEMLEDVQAHIPPFRAVLSPHDNPSMLRDWDRREEALKAVQAGKTLDIRAIEEGPANLLGWRAACSPDSPARQEADTTNWDAPEVFSTFPLPFSSKGFDNKTFIYSHDISTDPCMHPSHLVMHGQFISHRKGPVPERRGGGFIPMFSYSPTRLHDDIVVAVGEGSHVSSPSLSQNVEDTHDLEDLGWDSTVFEDDFGMDFDIDELLKLPLHDLEHTLDLDTDSRLLWRGSNTGMWHAPGRGWERSQRSRLVFWAGGGEGVVARGPGENAERDLQNEFGEYVDVKTSRALGAGMGGTLDVLVPPSNIHSNDTSSVFPSSDSNPSNNISRRAVGSPLHVKKALWAPSMLDVAFTAAGSDDGGVGPLNCEGLTCEKLRKVFEWRRRMELTEASQYRFVMDVDGNAWSSRFRKLLAGPSPSPPSSSSTPEDAGDSKTTKQKRWDQHLRRRRTDEPPASLVFKCTIYKEWWADRSQAWVHYIPIQVGLEDLWDALVFFRGKLGEEVDDLLMELRQHKLKEQERQPKDGEAKSDDEKSHAEKMYERRTLDLERRARDVLERHLLGRRIARRGREWAARYWRKEDMVAYMFRLFLEYARVMSPDRDQMFFDPDDPYAGVKEPGAQQPQHQVQQVLDLKARDEIEVMTDTDMDTGDAIMEPVLVFEDGDEE